MPFLVWRDTQGEDQETEVGDVLTIGRSPDPKGGFDGTHLQVADAHISRQHARIERTFRGLELHDVGSSNGTRVNASPLSGYHVLDDGDVIGVGGTIFTFRLHRLRGVAIVSGSHTNERATTAHQTAILEFPIAADIATDADLRHNYERLRVAHKLSRSIVADADPKLVLQRIVDAALQIFGADRCVILLHNARNDEYEPEIVRHLDPTKSDETVMISRTILQQVIRDGNALISCDAIHDARLSSSMSIMMQGIRSTMTVPLTIESRVRGIIHLDSSRAVPAFDQRDLLLVQEFAEHAARALHFAELAEARSQQNVAQQRLERLLPASIVADVMGGKRDLVRGGDVREATVLFCDIRGFTSMSEALAPREVVDILNEYFELMVEQVFAFEGALDKFIGDEIMAVWGAHVPVEDHAYKAVCAAIQMQDSIGQLNALRATRGLRQIAAGVGINTGQLVAGYMGSHRAMNYTVIGDTVNVAARLCSAAGPGDIVVSGAVAEALKARLRLEALPARPLKGKTETVELFRVLGH